MLRAVGPRVLRPLRAQYAGGYPCKAAGRWPARAQSAVPAGLYAQAGAAAPAWVSGQVGCGRDSWPLRVAVRAARLEAARFLRRASASAGKVYVGHGAGGSLHRYVSWQGRGAALHRPVGASMLALRGEELLTLSEYKLGSANLDIYRSDLLTSLMKKVRSLSDRQPHASGRIGSGLGRARRIAPRIAITAIFLHRSASACFCQNTVSGAPINALAISQARHSSPKAISGIMAAYTIHLCSCTTSDIFSVVSAACWVIVATLQSGCCAPVVIANAGSCCATGVHGALCSHASSHAARSQRRAWLHDVSRCCTADCKPSQTKAQAVPPPLAVMHLLS